MLKNGFVDTPEKVWRNDVDINHINPFQTTQEAILFWFTQFNFHFWFCGCISLLYHGK